LFFSDTVAMWRTPVSAHATATTTSPSDTHLVTRASSLGAAALHRLLQKNKSQKAETMALGRPMNQSSHPS